MTFFDASALVKRYLLEPESERVCSRLRSGLCAIARSSEVEVASAVSRRSREGSLTESEREAVLDQLAEDVPRFVIVELTPTVVGRTRRLLARHPLRAADAIQLASALVLADEMPVPVGFMAFDQRLVAAARAERLEIL